PALPDRPLATAGGRRDRMLHAGRAGTGPAHSGTADGRDVTLSPSHAGQYGRHSPGSVRPDHDRRVAWRRPKPARVRARGAARHGIGVGTMRAAPGGRSSTPRGSTRSGTLPGILGRLASRAGRGPGGRWLAVALPGAATQ